MADKAFPIYFNWNDRMREFLDPIDRCIVMDALADYYENGADPMEGIPDDKSALKFAISIMIDTVEIKKARSAEMAERGRAGANKRYGGADGDEPKQSDSSAMAEPKQSYDHYNENNNEKENNNNFLSNEGGARGRARDGTPPTEKEVAAYIREKGYAISPKRFCAYYRKRGWNIDDWREKLDEWSENEIEDKKPPDQPERASSFDTDEFFNMAVEASLKRTYGEAAG